jgi:flagellar biosynthesis protein FlhB
MASDLSRTERATPRKREDERKKGNIFQSRDAVSALSLLAMILLIRMAGGPLLSGMKNVLQDSYGSLATMNHLTALDASNIMGRFALSTLLLILPISGVAMVLGVVLGGVQTRFLFAASLLKPKLSRLNPMTGIKNLFSSKSLVELIKSIVKIVIIGAILYSEIVNRVLMIRNMPLNTLESGIVWTGEAIYSVSTKILMFMVAFAAADYFYQWWNYEKRMRMTKQEVREEQKRIEGDPNIKGRIREVQRKMAMMRMMQKVPKADVVIRNPTHFAVALQYDPKKDRAPVVVAKGADQIALTIVRIAQEHGVYVTENKPLARGLYEAVDIGKQIPEAFYKPVADIIAFIYKLKKRTAG